MTTFSPIEEAMDELKNGKMKKILLITFIIISNLIAQNGLWDAITPIKKVDKLVIYEGDIYGASRGGIVKIDPQLNKTYITKGNGLGGVNTPDITVSNRGVLAFNSSSNINFYNGTEWLAGEKLSLSGWMKINSANDLAWVSYKTGVIVFEYNDGQWEYRDFFNQFPAKLNGTIQPVSFNDKIFLFAEGQAVSAPADYHLNNLKNIQNWSTINFWGAGDILNDYAIYQNRLYLASNNGLIEADEDENTTSLPQLPNGSTAVTMFVNSEGLFAMGGSQIYKYESSSWSIQASLPATYKSFVKRDNTFILSSYYADLTIFNIGSEESTLLELDRPLGMRFRKFESDEKGNIYAATTGFYGGSPDRAAFYIDGKWYDLRVADSHYNRFGYGNAIESVGMSHAGEIIWSTYGRGMYIQRGLLDFQLINRSGNHTAEFRINNQPLFVQSDPQFNDYLGYVSVESDTTFTITQDMYTDINGNIWITNYITHTYKALICIKAREDGSISLDHDDWLYWDMRVPYSASLNETSMGTITIDPFDQIWIGSKYEGLAMLNYNYTLENQTDDSWQTFTVLDGLSSNQVLSIASDDNGTIFVGTDNGLNMISGTNVYKLKGEYAPLGPRINGIEKDSKGNLWFASDIGISMLEADKNAFEADSWTHFTTDNSGLLNNFCNGLYIDEKNQRILIGTEQGISIFNTLFLDNIENKTAKLTIGPNPFKIGYGNLLISGINRRAGLKILNSSGYLIREFLQNDIKSGVVYWDGKNSLGQFVATGVYLFVSANDESKLQTAKAVIIH